MTRHLSTNQECNWLQVALQTEKFQGRITAGNLVVLSVQCSVQAYNTNISRGNSTEHNGVQNLSCSEQLS